MTTAYDDLGGVRIVTAAKMLEYDKSTIRRKVAAGDLETFGEGTGTRVSLRSIRAYQNGERGKWRKSEKTPTKKASTDRDLSTKMRMVRSQPQSEPEKEPSRFAGVRPRAR